MSYFENFPVVEYQFGSNGAVLGYQSFQDISAYVDVIDQYADAIGTFSYYNIMDGDRADTLSQRFYGRPDYHWAFWLMNDHIRESGWPLSRIQLLDKMQTEYSGCAIATRTDIYGSIITGTNTPGPLLLVGDVLTGSVSSATGTVTRIDPDNGQVFIAESNAPFQAGEAATWTDANSVLQTLVVVSCVDEYYGVDHYEDGNGEQVDIDPLTGPGALINEVTTYDVYNRRNEELKQIKLIKPEYIEQVVDAFNTALEG